MYHGEYTLQETVILTQLNLNMQARDLERMAGGPWPPPPGHQALGAGHHRPNWPGKGSRRGLCIKGSLLEESASAQCGFLKDSSSAIVSLEIRIITDFINPS